MFDPVQNSNNILVNILPLDEQDDALRRASKGRAHDSAVDRHEVGSTSSRLEPMSADLRKHASCGGSFASLVSREQVWWHAPGSRRSPQDLFSRRVILTLDIF